MNDLRQQTLDFLNGKTPGGSIDERTWRSMVRWANGDVRKQVSKIEDLRNAGKYRLARRTSMQTTERLGVRFAFAARAAHKKIRSSNANHPQLLTLRQNAVKEALPNIGDFRHPATATLRNRRKINGGIRVICDFNVRDYAQQMMLSAIYKPFADFHPAQFQRKHEFRLGGTAAVREALIAALNTASDNDVFLHIDVCRFFDHVNCSWLERKLWLPNWITRAHAHTADMVIHGNHCVRSVSDEANWVDRLGLPQGSALSPLLADLVMAEILRAAEVPEKYPLFVWSDNIGVLVPRREAATIEELFRAAFAEHGAGPFTLTASIHPVTQEFKFVGYWFRRFGGKGTAYIPYAVANAWVGKIFERLSSATSIEEIWYIERHAQSKLNQWAWWPGCAEYHQSVLDLIAGHRDLLGCAMSQH